jgi:MinD superfamily P-loop ATPase
VLANWWVEEICALEIGASRCSFCFMDGPYEIRCRVDSEGVVCRAISDRKVRIVVTTWRTQVETLAKIVREYGRQVLQHCDQSGISGHDVDSLRMKLAR